MSPGVQEELGASRRNSADLTRSLARYSVLEITPQAIRGGAPLSVELFTA
jgi:hypothetical protein